MRNRLMIVTLVLVAVCGLALVCYRSNKGRLVFATPQGSGSVYARWSADGKSIHYAMGFFQSRLYTYDIASRRTSYQVLPPVTIGGITSISPDGKSATAVGYKERNRIFRIFDGRQKLWRSIPFLKNADDVLWLKPDTLLVFKGARSQQRAYTISLSDNAKPVMLTDGSKPLRTGVERGDIEGNDKRALPSCDGTSFAYIDRKGMPHVYDLLARKDLALKLHPAMKAVEEGSFDFIHLSKNRVVYWQKAGNYDGPVCATDLTTMKSRLIRGIQIRWITQISPDFRHYWIITNVPMLERDIDPPSLYLRDMPK